ncbi:MAG: ribonuclease P protein component [Bacteroidales bacterium]|nr:ribonuclease P protein component [Bacteroidales bacterium]MDD3521481.1 ribonuclease P protein component [Bacteroidales bacterium]MDD4030026.1 ribonuclease P protein component [Bacteroidales bacterium]MDD4435540.1 ribonuclease P protein component [Bacteroidales bacterium]MDD5733607.1 ribonuclease P protein component [Bacteroidales bacterium]
MKPEFSYTFPKRMRLSSRKEIESLFTDARSFTTGPFRVFFRASEEGETLPGCSIAFAVPKKHLKSAVKRNLVKRRLRESFRLNYPRILKPALEANGTRLIFLCLYLPREVKPFSWLETKMQALLGRFARLSEEGFDLSPDPAG